MNGRYRLNFKMPIRPCLPVWITLVLWLISFSTTSSLIPFVPRRGTRTWPNTPTTSVVSSHQQQQQHQHHQQQSRRPPSTKSSSSLVVLLASSSSNNKDQNPPKNQRTKNTQGGGVYVRPSSAIERGSGFFVPGLEGPKVRLLVGCILFGLTAVNHWLSEWSLNDDGSSTITTTTATDVPELVALTYSIYVLFQAVIEFAKEQQQQQQQQTSLAGVPTTTTTTSSSSIKSSSSSSNNKQLVQQWSSSSSSSMASTTTAVLNDNDDDDDTWEAFQSRVEWAAATFLSLTPAAGQLLLLSSASTSVTTTSTSTTPNQKKKGEKDGDEEEGGLVILYRLGPPQQQQRRQTDDDDSTIASKDGIAAAFRALEQSTSGRIALPLTHPAVTGLASVLGIPSYSSSSEEEVELQLLPNNVNDTSIATAPTTIRTVVLQRITPHLCWMMTSDELLARFTNQDWKWLTQLSRRVAIGLQK
jgi:hypothetical protein